VRSATGMTSACKIVDHTDRDGLDDVVLRVLVWTTWCGRFLAWTTWCEVLINGKRTAFVPDAELVMINLDEAQGSVVSFDGHQEDFEDHLLDVSRIRASQWLLHS
jgi:hypothetical protein